MLVPGTYEEIKDVTFKVVQEKIDEGKIDSIGIQLVVKIFLQLTNLSEIEKEKLMREVFDYFFGNIDQKRINVEKYCAHGKVLSFVSPF